MSADSSIKDPQTYQIIGAAIAVHKKLGCGFLESVYQRALQVEFDFLQIEYGREVKIPVKYWEKAAGDFQADFICYDSVIVELKALSNLSGIEDAQVLNYLKATGFERGLLLNFGKPSLEHKRFVNSYTH